MTTENGTPKVVTYDEYMELYDKLSAKKQESEWSPEIGALAAALAKAQLSFDPLLKDTDNPYYRSKYADLSSVIKATQKHLAANGLVVIQSPINREREAGVITLLAHSSGQWHKSSLFLPAVMQGKDGKERFDAQSVGSALTYARRYTYQAAIGIAAEIDDDANSAVGIGSKEASKSVGDAKVAALRGKKTNGAPEAPTALFYTIPEAHSGHFAEFINIKAYGSALNEVAAEGLRQLLKPYIAKVTKDETVLVSTSKMDALLEDLTNNQVQYKLLEAR